MSALDNCHNIEDLRKLAKRKLPSPMFNYIDGGADDEWTLKRNTQAFNEYQFNPNYLRNIENINLQTDVLGSTLKLPFERMYSAESNNSLSVALKPRLRSTGFLAIPHSFRRS